MHEFAPVVAILPTKADGMPDMLGEPVGYFTECLPCGLRLEAATIAELAAMRADHATPGMGDLARRLFEP
jgi:hypothetical protein